MTTGRDAVGPLAGLYDSPWPAEDGGPRRQFVPRGRGIGLRAGERLVTTTRACVVANMVVLRAPGELFPPSSDFDGDPRPSGPGCDIGADEHVPP